MNENRKPSISNTLMGINPFANNLKIEVNKVTFEKQFSRDKDGVWLPVEKELEIDKSCRIYINREKRLLALRHSARAKDLLMWIIYETEVSCEWIWINKKRYMAEVGVSSVNTYKGALIELIKSGYILSSVVKDTFWINPALFFNGSRVAAFPNNVKVK